MKRYRVKVEYDWSDTSYRGEGEVLQEVVASSQNEAEQIAASNVQKMNWITEIHKAWTVLIQDYEEDSA